MIPITKYITIKKLTVYICDSVSERPVHVGIVAVTTVYAARIY